MSGDVLHDRTHFKPGPDNVGHTEADDLDEGFNPEITEGNKYWVLLGLGFKPTAKGKWFNDRHGIEIEFNLQTDNIPSITGKISAAASQLKHDQIANSLKTMFNL